MKKLLAYLLCVFLLPAWSAAETETLIHLGDTILVNGAAISEDPAAAVYLARQTETHGNVPAALQGLENRVVTITSGGAGHGAADEPQLRRSRRHARHGILRQYCYCRFHPDP